MAQRHDRVKAVLCGNDQVAEKVLQPSKTFQGVATCSFNNFSTAGDIAVVTLRVTSALHDGMLQTRVAEALTC